ncbi:MAG: thiol reductant ABC exporter, CydC subunit [Rhodobacteraceae bacterium HLUCCO07]|nr:MAG: thiol reductant ABC exporter, CydC subunit [Rhodobacteraceae bacterium HLUCCO07]
MRHLWKILMLIWRAERVALLRGVVLSITVLVMGLALLGLSGWFITAAGLAGLLGLGTTFDIFRPSAGVRFLAIGRTAARYGERLLNHDATLRALAALRVRLMQALAAQGWERLGRLRGSEMLNRLGADVDALDGAMLRLAIPAVAAGVTLGLALVVMSLLTTPLLAIASVGSFTLGGVLALIWVTMRARKPSRRAGRAVQALRIRMIDLLRAKADLAVMGRLAGARASTLAASARLDAARAASDAVEHRANGRLGATTTIATTIALFLGVMSAREGLISAPQAALGFFVMLAVAETLAPLRRGLTELGAMLDAAARVDHLLGDTPEPRGHARAVRPDPMAPALEIADLRYRYPGAAAPVVDGFTLRVQPGEAVALMGRSGSGKSTVLHLAAGLIAPDSGTIRLAGRPLADWSEEALRNHVGLLPQRSTLMRGTIAEALRLGAPEASEADLRAVLEVVQLARVIAERGGLDANLAEAGAGLSGGEARRLALARLLLRRPRLLLLDEPTEGLDDATADRVMAGLRDFAPRASILIATHRLPPAKAARRIAAMV